ncbi:MULTISPECIES: pyruvate formate-lyase-activating protein [unclassified Pseudactinotalea]|uniref:pyruvate formate-lyase-activating protein n=2 Tax=Pseudactinotalea TaxID=1926259 RepID=UPI003C7D7863
MTALNGACGAAAPGDEGFMAPRQRLAGAGLAGLPEAALDQGERFAAMRSGELGSVHSWELSTAVDGPGTRLVVFLAGCPLRCQFCHNPDTLRMEDGHAVMADDVLALVRRYRKVFAATGGGLTLSGGEVLMQSAFAARILAGAKQMGVHTAIDTSGYLGAACTEAMLGDVDLVLLDVKSGDEQTYERVTRASLAPTLEFGDRLAGAGVEIWVRFVLVPGLTDAAQNVDNVAGHAARWDTVSRVEVLPFHQMGRDKWTALGLDYTLADTEPPSPELTERTREQFRAHGLTTY